MKKFILLFLTSLCTYTVASAQTGFQSYANNINFQSKDFGDIKGSAFSTPDWAKGTVHLDNNTTYTDLEMKYSDYEDKVFVKKGADVMEFDKRVKDFTLSVVKNDLPILDHYRNGYKNIPGYNADAYFQVLADGKVQLLKKTVKKIRTENEYGSMTTNKSFSSNTHYFLVKDQNATTFKKDKKTVLETLSDKQAQIDTYLKTNKIDFKNDDDLVKLLTYYNSL